eukprot:GHVU01196411.1.p1 GENE.GHVU01196411.1~~GHVU01196411.1.p1  ORF type:complete len:343 (-),score=50.41 GHVU01196411.1:211-1239(-)
MMVDGRSRNRDRRSSYRHKLTGSLKWRSRRSRFRLRRASAGRRGVRGGEGDSPGRDEEAEATAAASPAAVVIWSSPLDANLGEVEGHDDVGMTAAAATATAAATAGVGVGVGGPLHAADGSGGQQGHRGVQTGVLSSSLKSAVGGGTDPRQQAKGAHDAASSVRQGAIPSRRSASSVHPSSHRQQQQLQREGAADAVASTAAAAAAGGTGGRNEAAGTREADRRLDTPGGVSSAAAMTRATPLRDVNGEVVAAFTRSIFHVMGLTYIVLSPTNVPPLHVENHTRSKVVRFRQVRSFACTCIVRTHNVCKLRHIRMHAHSRRHAHSLTHSLTHAHTRSRTHAH